ncbi:hypothetical protein W02_23150 [Nitrospira sp. KM1]|uniref:hypothetical protein n=1 Tax=Nitrospira sp. KM1 TaxID=1936990 RepID=UPI0013A71643|nr:hypothetical protein [Nitrospira sp. KM1]BCA55175.1 hypothetical protein W02_23150 [Nitrospira sp. KM1]
MKRQNDRIDAFERALTEAYRSPDANEYGRLDVTQTVMRDIRQASWKQGGWTSSVVLEQLVWRTATIAAGIALVVTVLAVEWVRPTLWESPTLLAEEFESAPLFGD